MASARRPDLRSRWIAWVLAALFVLATAVPAQAEVIQIDKQKAHGNYPTVQASASVLAPKKLCVTVKARPRQLAMVYWWVDCSRGADTRSSKGSFREFTTVTRSMSILYDNPDECYVGVTASLDARGRITVILTARI